MEDAKEDVSKKDSIKEDVYIRLLKMAKEDLLKNKTISIGDFKKKLEAANISGEFANCYEQIYSRSATENLMKLEAYMALLEYEELKHALNESKQARKEAKHAMWIAAGAVIVQIVLWVFDKFALCESLKTLFD